MYDAIQLTRRLDVIGSLLVLLIVFNNSVARHVSMCNISKFVFCSTLYFILNTPGMDC